MGSWAAKSDETLCHYPGCKKKKLGPEPAGTAPHRGKKRTLGRFCSFHRKKLNKVAAQSHQRLRSETIELYGGQCACCGEKELRYLQLDHIKGGGNKHRKKLGIGYGALRAAVHGINVQTMITWARRNCSKGTLQVLCANCNFAKAYYGGCPQH